MENWDDLRFFLAAARTGSSRAAARVLGVNQSTISRRLADLEQRHGVRLFERRARGLELTESGQEILESAGDIERRFAELDRVIVGRDTRHSGRIKLSLSDALVTPLAKVLADFKEAYPDIVTEVLVDSGVVSLSRGEADVVLRLAGSPPEHLVGRRIAKVGVAAYGARDQFSRVMNLDRLARQHWIRWARAWRKVPTEAWIDAHVPPENVAAVVNSDWAMAELTAAGAGVGFQLCYTADRDARVRRVSGLFDLDIHLWLLTHADIRTTARIRVFLQFVGDALTTHKRKIEGQR